MAKDPAIKSYYAHFPSFTEELEGTDHANALAVYLGSEFEATHVGPVPNGGHAFDTKFGRCRVYQSIKAGSES